MDLWFMDACKVINFGYLPLARHRLARAGNFHILMVFAIPHDAIVRERRLIILLFQDNQNLLSETILLSHFFFLKDPLIFLLLYFQS